MVQRTINITGCAKNINGQAAVVAEKAGTYFVEGLHRWNKDWVEQRIRVIGDLLPPSNKKISLKVIGNPLVQLL